MLELLFVKLLKEGGTLFLFCVIMLKNSINIIKHKNPGVTSSLLCPLVRVQDGGVFILGMPVFPTHSPLHLASAILSSAPQPPKSAIEVRRRLFYAFFRKSTAKNPHPPCVRPQMLLFPALSFLQEGRLSSLEFVTQELSSQVQVRLQIFRPHCPHQKQHLLLPGESQQINTNAHWSMHIQNRC